MPGQSDPLRNGAGRLREPMVVASETPQTYISAGLADCRLVASVLAGIVRPGVAFASFAGPVLSPAQREASGLATDATMQSRASVASTVSASRTARSWRKP